MDKRPAIISRMFDSIAPTYDLLNTLMSFSMDRFLRKALIKDLGLCHGDTVLDIATGTGVLAAYGLEKGSRVIGIDISQNMLKIAKRRKPDMKNGYMYELVRCDACSMPFRESSFKKAMIAFGIRNIISLEAFFSEAFRVLDFNGCIIALEFSVPENPVIKLFYRFYLGHIIPFVGGAVSGDKAAYKYLNDSVMTFSSPEEIIRLIKRSGFKKVKAKKIMFGTAHLYIAEKLS